jgi:hypothetical protein
MKTAIRSLMTGIILIAYAPLQAQPNSILVELNHDIWKPFINGVNTNNPAMYNGVNSTDFYWVLDGEKPRIMNLAEYIDDAEKVMKSRTARGITTQLDVRFVERNVTSEFASEKCIVKYTSITPGKEPEVFYGFFHVFSRKENGVWKKLVQHAGLGNASQEQFVNAQPIE